MTTEDALIAAVLAAPDDDLPRLVLADHYEGELGQPERAEFIRKQIGVAQFSREYSEPDYNDVFTKVYSARRYQHAWIPGELLGNDEVIVVRGFIKSVKCHLATWVGGECPSCRGGRMDHDADGVTSCEDCNRTGRTHGIGPQIVRRQPVERVVLTDREPVKITLGPWAWADEATVNDAGTFAIPSHLFDLLEGGKEEHHGLREHPERIMTYERREEADAALSAAALLWAKSQPEPARISTSPVSVDVTT